MRRVGGLSTKLSGNIPQSFLSFLVKSRNTRLHHTVKMARCRPFPPNLARKSEKKSVVKARQASTFYTLAACYLAKIHPCLADSLCSVSGVIVSIFFVTERIRSGMTNKKRLKCFLSPVSIYLPVCLLT